jgi:tRNA pseudouridine38-40 synthase
VRYRARVEYDGTDFSGFQVQPGARTVQGELEAALARICGGSPVRVVAAGRTDAGVHATGQVIAFTDPRRRTAAELARALNALLPEDVSIREVKRVPPGFNPRYAARYREYRYTVWNGPRSPLRERFALGVRDQLDIAAMERAGAVLVGRHDFSPFGAAHRQPVRTVHWVRVRRNGSLVTIDVAADAFLGQMVRRIVAVLLEAGHGKTNEEAVAAALASKRPAYNGATAPAQGLCLRRVVLGPMRVRNAATDTNARSNGER